MDHSLPGLDGCEATRMLKNDPRTKTIPVIMVTGHALTSIEELARECGADDFRTKPLTPSDLIEAIVTLIERLGQRA
jgi:CheY-like chemotaxis protein